ncbi:group II intron reverse transcriptase/maturase [Clostridium sporogenes]|uniref:group II intron reverse transcriptase/maturase n=1 Tax=Clostridium sporogenes TaxID=1509 RepID=UPI002901E1B6|nr:group II intron reverse transcriptase/maturase [Pseudomonas aeruginosa]
MQSIYDKLYYDSKNGNNFYKLIEIIGSEQNIRLAYRNIKTNKGSKTSGTDGLTIKDICHINDKTLINKIRNKLSNYKPQSVRRVEIPKEGSNKTRPLGIPTIWDRILQQCILQVLEPICEPKFHNHSYGFRPNRSTHHAVSRVVSLVNIGKHHYCVDIDIKGFFDNVNHGKLLKQMWNLGIRDKRLISIIGKILKSEIEGEGVPTKGTPQGGIISPLLSNIVLNELDWWVSNQWETIKLNNKERKINGFHQYARKYTTLKDGFIVRYADDFKIMCRTYQEAKRYYYAVVDFLKVRLGLDISPEKSKVINLKRNSSNFLGFKIKAIPKGKTKYGYIAKTEMNEKALKRTKCNLKNKVKDIQKSITSQNVIKYNLMVLGIQNYYKIATNIYNNLTEVNYTLMKSTRIRLRNCSKTIRFEETSANFKRLVKGIKKDSKIVSILNIPMLPLTEVHHCNPKNFSQDICNYTADGRKKIHENLKAIPKDVLNQVRNRCSITRSIEYNDNRLSRYIAQYGKCYITNELIGIDRVHCHHIIPLKFGGTDNYSNLTILNADIHKLLHMTNKQKIKKCLKYINLSKEQLKKLNDLRSKAGVKEILLT